MTEDSMSKEDKAAKHLFDYDNIRLIIFVGLLGVVILGFAMWELCYWRPRNPEYRYFQRDLRNLERNWKYERQQKEAEFAKKLDFRDYYRRRRSTQPGAAIIGESEGQNNNKSLVLQRAPTLDIESPDSAAHCQMLEQNVDTDCEVAETLTHSESRDSRDSSMEPSKLETFLIKKFNKNRSSKETKSKENRRERGRRKEQALEAFSETENSTHLLKPPSFDVVYNGRMSENNL